MSQHDRDAEDLLRRALRSAADSLEPSEDGLERIRARLTTPHAPPVAWIIAAYSGVTRRFLGGLDSIWTRLPRLPGPAWQSRRVRRPRPQPWWHPLRMHLTVAAVVAAFAVAMGVSAVTPPLRLAIAQTGSLIRSVGSRLSGSTGGLRVNGHGAMPFPGRWATATATAGTQNRTRPGRASCVPRIPIAATSSANPAATATPASCAAPASGPSPASNPGPSLSPTSPASPTPATSPSPSVSPTESASPSPTASPTPPASPSPSASLDPG